jgi:hypothetical protein
MNDDPMQKIIRRALNAGPKTIADLGAALRQDAGVADSFESIEMSEAVALTCALELGARPNLATEEQRVAVNLLVQSKSGRPAGCEIAVSEILWASPTWLNRGPGSHAAVRY